MKTVPSYSGTLRSHQLDVPHCISKCSGIRIFGRRIKSLVFSTDVAIIQDKCGSWYNLNRGIIEEAVPEAWVLQLEPLGNWNMTTEEP